MWLAPLSLSGDVVHASMDSDDDYRIDLGANKLGILEEYAWNSNGESEYF